MQVINNEIFDYYIIMTKQISASSARRFRNALMMIHLFIFFLKCPIEFFTVIVSVLNYPVIQISIKISLNSNQSCYNLS